MLRFEPSPVDKSREYALRNDRPIAIIHSFGLCELDRGVFNSAELRAVADEMDRLAAANKESP